LLFRELLKEFRRLTVLYDAMLVEYTDNCSYKFISARCLPSTLPEDALNDQGPNCHTHTHTHTQTNKQIAIYLADM